MESSYKNAVVYLKKNPRVLVLFLLVEVIVSIIRVIPPATIIGISLALFFSVGFVSGVNSYKDSDSFGIKELVKESFKNFTNLTITMLEISMMMIVNIIVMLFFGLLPTGFGAILNQDMLNIILAMVFTIVIFYRAPLIILSFVATVLKPKERGRFAVVRMKEVIWGNKKLWLQLGLQFLIYVILQILATVMFMKSLLILVNIIDIIKGFIFFFFLIVNYYRYKEIIGKDFLKNYDKHNYEGRFKGIIGRILM